MTRLLPAHVLALACAAGLAFSNLARLHWLLWAAAGTCLTASLLPRPLLRVALALAVVSWWWGSVRLDALDHSALVPSIGTAGRALAVVTAEGRVGKYDQKQFARVRSFDGRRYDERVELELPLGRAPPQGAIVRLLALVRAPRGPSHGFDEATWLRRQGVHVVLRVDAWSVVGRRGGLGGLGDRTRAWLRRASAPGLTGERRALVEGVLLGDDGGLSDNLKQAFLRSGLYHLLTSSKMSMKTQMKLVGYIRVSRVNGREGESFISPKLQRESIEGYAKIHGHEIVKWADPDLDQPGSKLDRPGLQQALAAVRAGEAEGIIAAKLDRLTRSVGNLGKLLEDAKANGWNLIAVDLGLDFATSNGKLVANVLGSVAEWELDRRRESWMDAQANAVEGGIHVASRAPTGYRRGKDRRLVLDKKSARVIHELFERRAAGAGWSELAEWMRSTGVKSPYGRVAWSPSAVRNIIKNRVYLGEARSGEHVKKDAHPPIVTRAEFAAAQLKYVAPKPNPSTKEPPLLSGLVRCAGCRYTTKADYMTGRGGERLGLYRCRAKHTHGRACPSPSSALARVLDPFVEQVFLEHVALKVRAAHPLRDDGGLVAVAQEAFERAERELREFVVATSAVRLGAEVFQEGLSARQSAVDAAAEQLGESQRQQASDDLPASRELLEMWPELDVNARRDLIRAAIDCVVIHPVRGSGTHVPIEERVTIVWHGQAPDDLPGRGKVVELKSWPS